MTGCLALWLTYCMDVMIAVNTTEPSAMLGQSWEMIFSLIMYATIPFCFKCTEYHVVISSTVPLLDLSCISWKNKNLLLDNG